MGENLSPQNTEVNRVKLSFDSLSVYRNLLEDRVLKGLYNLVDYLYRKGSDLSTFVNLYNDFYFSLGCSGSGSLKDYIIDVILFDENPFSLRAGKPDSLKFPSSLEGAASKDLVSLQAVGDLKPQALKSYALHNLCTWDYEENAVNNLPEWDAEGGINLVESLYSSCFEPVKKKFNSSSNWSELIHDLTEFYRVHGCGMYARYRAFTWERASNCWSLKGIENPDPTTLSDLIGYEFERSKVVENTVQFLKGYPANNVLLYGDRGTGKSSTVKALLNQYHMEGLRLIEIPKDNLTDFPELLRVLKGRPQKFIVFVDDLAFEDNEESYTALKAVLEGGLESRPRNVLIYATSNRRHLIKEKFSDRLGFQSPDHEDQVRAGDNLQEKLSLADRFGITVVFSSPDQNRYLKIVEGIVEKRGIKVDKERLHKEALKWELRYNGRSPRTARQFVDWMEGAEADL